MIEIPWEGPSVIVPAEAIEVLHKFNQNFNYVPLVQCKNCHGFIPQTLKGPCCSKLAISYYAREKCFCAWPEPIELACQKTDKETAALTLNEVFIDTARAAQKQIMALGC